MLAVPPGVPLTVRVPVLAAAVLGANCRKTSQCPAAATEVPLQVSCATKNSPVTTVFRRPEADGPAFVIWTSMPVSGDDTDPDVTDPNATTAVDGSVTPAPPIDVTARSSLPVAFTVTDEVPPVVAAADRVAEKAPPEAGIACGPNTTATTHR
jgi:hypothetical protein